MEPIERVYTSLYHEEPDKVPDWWEDARGVFWLNQYYKMEPVIEEPNFRIFRSLFGSLHLEVRGKEWEGREEWSWSLTIAPAVRWQEDLERLEKPDLDPSTLKEVVKSAKKFHDEGYFVYVAHNTPFFSPISYLRGLKQFLIDITVNKDFAKRLVEFSIEPQIKMTTTLIEEAGIDCVWVFGDMGTPQGPFISPRTYRELFFPYDKKMCETYHNKGAFVFLHSHGYIMPIIEDLINAGFDAIHPISPLCRMNLKEMKEKYGDKITLFAELSVDMSGKQGINTEKYGSIQYGFKDIEEKIKALEYTIKVAAPGGGFIFASAPQLKIYQTPQEQAYKKMWEKLRKYPVKR
ncbi:MAG: uroporphyrinogen decarboxylase family protein [candidate division WOR-3 bacterium]